MPTEMLAGHDLVALRVGLPEHRLWAARRRPCRRCPTGPEAPHITRAARRPDEPRRVRPQSGGQEGLLPIA